jgi:hypothetical protein
MADQDQSKSTEGSDKCQVKGLLNKQMEQPIHRAKEEQREIVSRSSKKVDLPDMFANVKLKNPNKFLKYRKIPHRPSENVIPEFYVHFKERVNGEAQKIEEKFWTFSEKMYEITEEKVEQLKEHSINLSPSDYEWVIDCFEKTAINDGTQYKPNLIEYFRSRMRLDVQSRVTDQMMHQIYDICWKNQREYRSDRSFIREFWCYQNAYGPDNYKTFQTQEVKTKQSYLRANYRQKKLIYQGCFMEREAAIVLTDEIKLLFDNCQLQQALHQVEEDQFDRLLGVLPPT